jgi:signal transduction histidine kinase
MQDRGVGMPSDQQTRIFGRFEQVVGQHRGSGFGVGLWVASRLVAAMDGRIAVSSRLGEGSTFTVTLPLVPPEPDQATHATG